MGLNRGCEARGGGSLEIEALVHVEFVLCCYSFSLSLSLSPRSLSLVFGLDLLPTSLAFTIADCQLQPHLYIIYTCMYMYSQIYA